MKRQYKFISVCCFLVLAFISNKASAQDTANYVLTEKYIKSDKAQEIRNYDFFDDLGRETTKATNGLSNNGEFVYSHKEYTGEDNVSRQWLPVVDNTSIAILNTASVSRLSSGQYSDPYGYESTDYDMMGRVTAKTKAGVDWNNPAASKPARVSYVTNTSNDVICYKSLYTGTDRLQDLGYYRPGTLNGVCEENEDGVKITTYKDVFGKKILERRGLNNDTYYVYDDFGRLMYVLMPEYQKDKDLNKYAYQYDYDVKGNLTKKQIPGCEPIQYWYDKNDRQVVLQDACLRQEGLYRFMLYDNLGRLAVQGIASFFPDITGSGFVSYAVGCGGIGNTDYKFSNSNENNISVENIEFINYYDGYSFIGGSHSKAFSGLSIVNPVGAKGHMTGSLVSASDGETVCTMMSYDLRGNILETLSKGLGGKIEDTKNTYSFTDKIESSTSEISSDQNFPFIYTVKDSYNPKNDDLSEVSLAMKCGDITSGEKKISYDFDQLGRLKNVTRLAGEDYTDQLSYEYDIHSWIKKIDTNFFIEELHYADGPGKDLFSGNISSLSWKHTQNNTPGKGYLFTYDELNRLTKAAYGENNFNSNMGYFNEEASYDENGNIESLHRNGLQQTRKYGTIDDLRMTYDGNKLSSVVESAPSVLYANSLDLKSGSDEIAYNGNGSLIMDGTRGITAIKYDRNNNPQRIQFNNGNVTEYIYTATGQKLRTIHYSAAPNTHVNMGELYTDIDKNYLSVDSTDYLMDGNLILENGKVDKMLFGDGYIQASYSSGRNLMKPIKTKDMSDDEYRKLLQHWLLAMSSSRKINSFAFYYFNKDHLGNIREVVDTEGLIHQTNDYYPFGTPFSNNSSDVSFQKYKYNGKELDMMHGLNTYDYGARQYDAILPSWDRIDPLAEKYYNVSPYVYCADNPVNAVDQDGKDVLIWYTEKGKDRAFLYNGSQAKVPNNQFVLDFVHTYNYLKSKGVGKNVVSAVKNPKVIIELQQSNLETEYDGSDRRATVFWEPLKGLKLSNGGKQSPAVRLEHEFDHAVDDIKNHKNHTDRRNVNSKDYDNAEEKRVIIGSEAETARKLGQGIRYDHKGTTFEVIDPRYIK